MTTPAVAEVSSATPSTLDSELGEMFGDFTGGGESPESDSESAAGTTPAEPSPEPVEGTEAPAGETPSDGATPDATLDDPFKDTTAATYYVNGQPVTSEDIRVFKEGGAVIRPESIPNVLSQLAERATLAEKFRTRDAEYQTLAKVAEWTDSTSGKTFSGPEAAIELRIGNAALLAENKLLVDLLTNPEKLRAALTTEPVFDGTRPRVDANGNQVERVIINPAALQTLQRENMLTQRELAATIREHYKGVIAESSKVSVPMDYALEAPKLVEAVAKSSNLDHSVLTPADRAMFAKLLPSQVANGKVSMDWQDLVKERIAERTANKASTQQLVSTTTDAVKKGQANLAAAARGVRQPVKPAAVVKQPSQQQTRIENEGDAFDAMIRSGSRALRSQA